MFLKGGILGGARQFWGNPYLNSTTVLFDECRCFGDDFFLVVESFLQLKRTRWDIVKHNCESVES